MHLNIVFVVKVVFTVVVVDFRVVVVGCWRDCFVVVDVVFTAVGCWLLMPGLLAGWSCFEEIVISAPGCRLLSAIYTRREIKWDFYYAWDKALTVILCVSLTKILSGYSEDKPVLFIFFICIYFFKPVLKLNPPPTHTSTRTHQVTHYVWKWNYCRKEEKPF